MRIDLYKIKIPKSFDLKTRVNHICAHHLQKRNRKHGEDQMRLETSKKEGDLWYFDFVRIRMLQGPAKTPLKSASTGFALQPDEGFGEETALLWNTSNDWCVVQYNHHSLRPSSIAEYLTDYDGLTDYVIRFAPKIDPRVLAKLRAKKIVTRFSMEIAPGELTDADFDAGVSLLSAAKSLQREGADTVAITLSARHGRGRSLNVDLEKVRDWISNLFEKNKGEAVIAASASVKEVPTERVEPIDLLAHQISAKIDVSPGVDRRLPLTQRWNQLFYHHELWSKYMT